MLNIVLVGLALAEVPQVHYAASEPCRDHRYPMVSGQEVIVCNDRQQPALAFDPATGRTTPLPALHRRPAADDLSPRPRMGSTPTRTPDILIWETDGPSDDADLWMQRVDAQERRGLDVGPGDQHHAVSSGYWIAWVSQGSIKLWNTKTGMRKKVAAVTGFNAPPALQGDWICWEFRSQSDIDLRCSNGFELRRPGHQTHPMLLGNRLLFREEGRLMSVSARVAK